MSLEHSGNNRLLAGNVSCSVLIWDPYTMFVECLYYNVKAAPSFVYQKVLLYTHKKDLNIILSLQVYGWLLHASSFIPQCSLLSIFLSSPVERKPFSTCLNLQRVLFFCVATLSFAHYPLCTAGASLEIYGLCIYYWGSGGLVPLERFL